MLYYRIAKKKFINDLDGTGARMYGGRWNHKGTPMLYLSESSSGAVLEYLVHVSRSTIPKNVYIAEIEIPDNATSEAVDITSPPRNWHLAKAPIKLADIGTSWINSGTSLILRVPSVPCFLCHNTLVNPFHKEMKKVKIKNTWEYPFDKRLFKKQRKSS